MDVIETIKIPNNKEHFIEFGYASWDNDEESIRRRKNRADGSFDPISSSEIPINSGFVDISMLICECLKRDKIDQAEMTAILNEVLSSAQRQNFKISIT